ncbi:MAG: polysaccharide biosynthesis tyrosine autokinase [Thermohalobaculum sp.]|nr:polysaccharide biosynthesis tyrosine autokinase [Thermohalobaculum sp.]
MLQKIAQSRVDGSLGRHPSAGPRGDDAVDLRQLLVTLFERKWTIVLFVVVSLGLAFVYLARAERTYTASSTVALNTRAEKVIDLTAVTSGLGTDYSTVMTEFAVLTSRGLMHRVVERLDLTNDPLFNPSLRPERDAASGLVSRLVAGITGGLRALREMIAQKDDTDGAAAGPAVALSAQDVAVDTLLGMIAVSSEEFIPVFQIAVTSPSPQTSAAIANAIADTYIVNQLEAKFDATAKATEWLTDRVVQLKARLEAAERKVEEFQSNSKLVSEDALQLQNKQLKDLRARLAQTQSAASAARAQLALVQPLAAAGDSLGAAALLPGREITTLLAEHDRATGERKALLAPRIAAMVDREIARLARDATDGAEQARLLGTTIQGVEAELSRQANDLIALRQLERETEASRALYAYFLTRQSETAVQEGIQQADARVISEAVPRTAPTSPRSVATMAIALFLGAFAGVSYVLVTGTWDTRFKLPNEIPDATGLALLGTVPVAPARSRRRLFERLVAPGTSDLSESLRNIRTSIQLANMDQPPKVVMVTSSMPAEGKTSLSLGLAIVTAATRKKVLIVECDMRRRIFAQYFGRPERPGLAAVLAGEASLADAAVYNEASGVFVLQAETMAANPADLFASEHFARFIDEARARFDFIVLDTPPVLAVSDARMIARVADAVVFCIRWRKTTRAIASDALELLTMHGVPVTGAVLTQVDRLRLAKYSYGGYGSYKAVYSYYRKA